MRLDTQLFPRSCRALLLSGITTSVANRLRSYKESSYKEALTVLQWAREALRVPGGMERWRPFFCFFLNVGVLWGEFLGMDVALSLFVCF